MSSNNKSTNKIPFYKSLKFKISIFNSLLLFILSSTLVLGINVYLNNYLRREPAGLAQNRPQSLIEIITEAERERIRQIRLEDLRKIQKISIDALIPMALLSFALGYFISDRMLLPISKLQDRVDSLKGNDLGSQIQVQSDDEVGSLTRSFNEMSLRLKKSFDVQTQFVQDASHELRTPLTVMQTNLDVVASDKNADKNDLKEAINKSLVALKEMRNLTDDLLTLTLPTRIKLEKVDLNALTLNQINMLKEFAANQGVKLIQKPSNKKCIVEADASLLGRAVYNLIENGIKYSKEVKDPEVSVAVETKKGTTLITVADNGIGIPVELQSKVFERFYRVDKSRNRKSGGFGLGLSIVKEIVTLHKGEISVESQPGNTKFIIALS